MHFWQNSTPFFGAAAFCLTKIEDFRRQTEREDESKKEEEPEIKDDLNWEDE